MTPLEFAFADAFTVVAILAIIYGLMLLIDWAWRGWQKAGRDIDEAVAMVCKPCSWTDPTAECTCPDKGCTAMGCPKRGVRRG